MSILVVSPKCSSISARKLAKALGAAYANPYQTEVDWDKYLGVINYGVSDYFPAKNILNNHRAVKKCINKGITFSILMANGIPVPDFAFTPDEVKKKDWDITVCRESAVGNNGKGLSYVNKGEPVPKCQLYTEYFNHKKEIRVVVLLGEVIGAYEKKPTEDGVLLDFIPMGLPQAVSNSVVKAADCLGIDYVGFDILYNNKDSFIILEANSGPVLVEGIEEAFIKYMKG